MANKRNANKGPMTVNEFARMGGKARKNALSPERRSEIARKAGMASVKAKKLKKKLASKLKEC